MDLLFVSDDTLLSYLCHSFLFATLYLTRFCLEKTSTDLMITQPDSAFPLQSMHRVSFKHEYSLKNNLLTGDFH